ncbi:MAG: hypothetical protein PVF17_00630 [Ignavibacteria bacterium]|jgi:hypothetical protein
MKFEVDGELILELSDIQKKIICHDVHEDEFEADMKRRVKYVLSHKYEKCMERLKSEWIPKLEASGVESIPLKDDILAEMIFSHPDYMSRKQREQKATKEN